MVDEYIKGNLKSTIDKGYETAKERSIEKIGLELKEVYERVYKRVNCNEKDI